VAVVNWSVGVGETPLVRRMFGLLRRNRYIVYVGGVALIALASLVGPAWSRTPVTVATLTVICTTYLAELHGRADGMRAESVVTAVAVAGVAGGTYLLVEVSRLGGALFVFGGVLFFRAAVRTGR
jgi:hypothetical protein